MKETVFVWFAFDLAASWAFQPALILFRQLKVCTSVGRIQTYETSFPFKGPFAHIYRRLAREDQGDPGGDQLEHVSNCVSMLLRLICAEEDLQQAKAQEERRGQEDGVANDVFVLYFQDRIAGIDKNISAVQRDQQGHFDRIDACVRKGGDISSISEKEKLQKRAASLNVQLELLKVKEKVLLSEKKLIEQLLMKQIRLKTDQLSSKEDDPVITVNDQMLEFFKKYWFLDQNKASPYILQFIKNFQSLQATLDGVRESFLKPRYQLDKLRGDTILRLIHKDVRAPSSENLEFPSSVRTKIDFTLPHKHCKVNFTASCIARDGAVDAIVRAANARRLGRVQQDRLSNPLMAIFAAPGGGKSFFIDTLGETFRPGRQTDRASVLDGSVVLAISFNGVCSTPAEIDLRDTNAQFALGVRALWSYFVDCSTADITDFERFYSFFRSAVPRLTLDLAVKCVRAHSGNDRILLLVDELMKAEEAREGLAVSVLIHIGEILSTDAEFNAVVTSLQPGPVQNLKIKSGRPIVWISLRPFTGEESEEALASILSYPILEDPALSELTCMVKLCISDMGGHPRSLENLKNVLIKELVPSVDPKFLQEAVVREFSKEAPSIPSMEAMKLALKGRRVALVQLVGQKSVEELIADGVFLNSEVSVNDRVEIIVPRISIMQIRLMMKIVPMDFELALCLSNVVQREKATLEPEELEVFHGNWEVLIRRLGVSGQMSLAEFYSRSEESALQRPLASIKAMVDFREKPDGLVRFDDAQSIYRSTPGRNMDYFRSCRAVFLGAPRQPGFDSCTIEPKASGNGYIAIFVNNKCSSPLAKTSLDQDDLAQCWKGCEGFLGNPVFVDLEITVADCFLVIAAWRTMKLREPNEDSRIIVLGREDLAGLYTPSLIARPEFIRRSNV
jgi:hypothetical protein